MMQIKGIPLVSGNFLILFVNQLSAFQLALLVRSLSGLFLHLFDRIFAVLILIPDKKLTFYQRGTAKCVAMTVRMEVFPTVIQTKQVFG